MEVPSKSSLSTALHDTGRNVTDGVGPQQMDTVSRMHEQGANKIIVTYLLERVEEFSNLCQLRQEVSRFYHEFEHPVSFTPHFRAGKIPKGICFSNESVLLQMLAIRRQRDDSTT
jgi:hypothetical protein